jgi:hypothetical protein
MTIQVTEVVMDGEHRTNDVDLPLKLGAPARRALLAAGYQNLDQIARVSEVELLRLHGMGPRAIAQLRVALAERGLTFAGRSTHAETS